MQPSLESVALNTFTMDSTSFGGTVTSQATTPSAAEHHGGNGGSNDAIPASDSTSRTEETSATPASSGSESQSTSKATSQDQPTEDSMSEHFLKDNDNKTAQGSTEHPNTPDGLEKDVPAVKTENKVTAKLWTPDNPVDLWCKSAGESHAVLVTFGYWNCPRCGQSLRKPEFKKEMNNSGGPGSSAMSGAAPKDPGDFKYHVRYLDSNDRPILVDAWDGPFDLSEARKDLAGTAKKEPPFRVETEVHTSINNGMGTYQHELDRYSNGKILANPNISVKVGRTFIIIRSQPLLEILNRLVSYYPSINLKGRSLTLWAPYDFVWHYHDLIEQHLSEVHGDDTHASGRKELRGLVDFVIGMNGKQVADEQSRYQKGVCTYEMLWLLYKPGTTVYVESRGRLSAFVISIVEYHEKDQLNREKPRLAGFTIQMWNLDYDGTFVGRHATEEYIPPFEGEREITSLHIIPCEYKDKEDGGETREGLITDGKMWYELLRGGQVFYSGHLLDDRKREFHGRVYVDTSSFYNIDSTAITGTDRSGSSTKAKKAESGTEISDQNALAPIPEKPPVLGGIGDMGQGLTNCPCGECLGFRPHPLVGFPWTDYELLNPARDMNLNLQAPAKDPDHRYLLCERKLHGFDLRSRNWLVLDAKCCQEPRTNRDAINKLVMHEDKKKMIKALIHKYSDSKAHDQDGDEDYADVWKADFIDNKGEGQIFLLHGSPGVGKTYTAGKHQIQLPNIGTDEVKMEKKLLNWFQLAEKWGAVMLIDEADVFLEARSTSDLKRNSLVSVFLRCVEYYRGVLFLTTNRVGQFDDAFMSRIHVVIHYRNLTPKDRTQIWQQFFEKLREERDFDIHDRAEDYIFGKDRKDRDGDDSGSNSETFQTAVALAEFRHAESVANDKKRNITRKTRSGPRLERKDFVQVCDMMQEFKSYLKSVHMGFDEEHRAYTAHDRALQDGYYPTPQPSVSTSTSHARPQEKQGHSRKGGSH
ncbi:hypothetical protein SMACR_09201 [Sordaria macrospora]|nr:hypothetical protein SMACR_09201 [Sordaria macrospora]WPJ66297.1 hypothetical protein SMAC4_09201 [Sordaria macrospora]